MKACLLLRPRNAALCLATTLASFACVAGTVRASEATVKLPYAVPKVVSTAMPAGAVSDTTSIRLAFTLPLRNQPELTNLIARLHDPADSLYGKYLTPDEFASRFGPTKADYDAVTAYAKSQGLTITAVTPNRTILDVAGAPSTIDRAFGVVLNNYVGKDGKPFFAADRAPSVPASIAAKVTGLVGLQTAFGATSNIARVNSALRPSIAPSWSGPDGYMVATDIKAAYDLSSNTFTGGGKGLGLFELDGFVKTDANHYAAYNGDANPTITEVHVDGATGLPNGSGGDVEVCLDVDMAIALAPKAHLYIYDAPNSWTSILDEYNKIATDNLAKAVSSSWGSWEYDWSGDYTVQYEEAAAFQQMAAQGQSMFAASGDYGAWDPSGHVSVQDPASQPYVCGVGGTTLYTNSDGSYNSEAAWGGSGGGYSIIWPETAYQLSAFVDGGGPVDYLARNVPDVSLDADPNSGYDIYDSYSFGGSHWEGGWGGTSAAAPLWAALATDGNQERGISGQGLLGFPNYMLYNLWYEGYYGIDMHDVTSGSNGYSAGSYYDDATGLGTYDGGELIWEFGQSPTGLAAPVTPANVVATVITGHHVKVTWNKSPGASKYFVYREPSANDPPLIGNTTTNSYTDNTTAHGTEYIYFIKAYNAGGYSTYGDSNYVTP